MEFDEQPVYWMITEIKGSDLPLEEAKYDGWNMERNVWVWRYVWNIQPFQYQKQENKKLIKQFKNRHGYVTVRIYKDGVGTTRTVHRLVAKTFIPNPENLPEVNHKDENKSNNVVSNLEWCTRKYNVYYGTGLERKKEAHAKAIKEGRTSKNTPRNCGENNPNAKLSDADVLYIREHYKKNDKEFGGVPLAKKFGITKHSLYRIIKNQRRKM